jgi:cytochrome c oxidase subunit 2
MADTTRKATVVSDPVAEGKRLMEKNGCVVCHSSDGSKIVGPSYKGVYGHKVTVITNGVEREITADDEYIKRSIYEPDADIVKGYVKGMMVSYKTQLNDQDIANMIEYLKTLK